MKTIKIVFFTVIFSIFLTSFAFANPSPNWYQENGFYKLKDSIGNTVTRAWICDDMDEGKPWYLVDYDGNMVAGLACDYGKWYLLGSNGQLQFKSQYFAGVYIDINNKTGSIKNLENVDYLLSIHYPVKYVPTYNNIYTSSFVNDAKILDNIDQFSDDDILDFNTAVAYASQLAGQSRVNISRNSEAHIKGDFNDFIHMSNNTQDILCGFVDWFNHGWKSSTLPRTKKNIEEAINKLVKLKK